jgi:hypothetical protein
MARTAPSGVIATSAPWLTLNLTLLAASSSMTAASATACSFGFARGLDHDRLLDLADEVVEHLADPIRDVVHGPGAGRLHRDGRMRDLGLGLGLGDELGVGHRREHSLRPFGGAFGVAVRRQPRRRFDEAGEHRGLADRHLLRRLAEIALCRGLDAIGAGPEIDAVQIQFQDLALGIFALQPQRELGLLQLARQRALLGQEEVLGELLGQGRAALRHAAMQDVGDECAGDADRIDAPVLVEAAVLDGDEGLGQIGRQILQRDIGAGHLAALGQHGAVDTDDVDGRRALGNLQ